jgi:tetratricopeptide (TPR) repeat protein
MKISRILVSAAFLAATSLQAAAAQDVASAISDIGHAWAKLYYQGSETDQAAQFPNLVAQADALVKQYPAAAEPLIWDSIILSSYAKVKGGLGAIDVATKARDAALASLKIDDKAMNAGGYASLGVLYYKVPGWPIGFGSDKKAKQYLDKAVAIAPDSIDVNYFYGDFMIEQGDKKQAKIYLEKALQAPPRPGREDADAGRKLEIQADLAKVGG